MNVRQRPDTTAPILQEVPTSFIIYGREEGEWVRLSSGVGFVEIRDRGSIFLERVEEEHFLPLGQDTACRVETHPPAGDSTDAIGNELGESEFFFGPVTLASCFRSCDEQESCLAVEYDEQKGLCAVMNRPVSRVMMKKRHHCYVKRRTGTGKLGWADKGSSTACRLYMDGDSLMDASTTGGGGVKRIDLNEWQCLHLCEGNPSCYGVESRAPFCELWFQPICGTAPRQDLGDIHCWVYNHSGCGAVTTQEAVASWYFEPAWQREIQKLNHSLSGRIDAFIHTTITTSTLGTTVTTTNDVSTFLSAYVGNWAAEDRLNVSRCVYAWLESNQARSIEEVVYAGMLQNLLRTCHIPSTSLTTTASMTTSTSTIGNATFDVPMPLGLREILERRVGGGDPARWQHVRAMCEDSLPDVGATSVFEIAARNSSAQDTAFLQGCGFRGVALEIELEHMAHLRSVFLDRCTGMRARKESARPMQWVFGIVTLLVAFLQLLLHDEWGCEEEAADSHRGHLYQEDGSLSCRAPLVDGGGRPDVSRDTGGSATHGGTLLVSSLHAQREILPPVLRYEDEADATLAPVGREYPAYRPICEPSWCRCWDYVMADMSMVYALEVWISYGNLAFRLFVLSVAVTFAGYVVPCLQFYRGMDMTQYFSYQVGCDAARILLPLCILAAQSAWTCPGHSRPTVSWCCCLCITLSFIDLALKAPRVISKCCSKSQPCFGGKVSPGEWE